MPLTRNPLYIAVRVTARIAAFIPGASPPDVRTPIHFITPIEICNFLKITSKDSNNKIKNHLFEVVFYRKMLMVVYLSIDFALLSFKSCWIRAFSSSSNSSLSSSIIFRDRSFLSSPFFIMRSTSLSEENETNERSSA